MGGEQTIVIDFGSSTTKAGFAADDAPNSVFDSVIGRPRYRTLLGEEMAPSAGVEPRLRPLFALSRPIERGALTLAAAEALSERVWSDLRPPNGGLKALLSDPIYSSISVKQSVAEMLVRRGASHVFFGAQPILSLLANGRTEGLLLEVGDRLTQIAAMYGGCRLVAANEKVEFGGADVTRYFGELMRFSGSLDFGADDFLCDAMKCALVEALPREAAVRSPATVPYTLPDGNCVKVGSERFEAAEALFRPHLAGSDALPTAELVVDTVRRLDIDIRASMFEGLHVAGGATMTVGFAERLAAEVAALVGEQTHVRVVSPAGDRSLFAWIGGAALCRLSSFEALWISRAELEEEGERVFLRKCI